MLPEGLLDSDGRLLPEIVANGLVVADDTPDGVTRGVSVPKDVAVKLVDTEYVVNVVTDADELSVGIVELERLEDTDIDTVDVLDP